MEQLPSTLTLESCYFVQDKYTDALQIVTHVNGKKEYIVLVPGNPSFVIINASTKSKPLLINALHAISDIVNLKEEVLNEIEIIFDLYLSLENIGTGLLKEKVKETISEIEPFLKSLRIDLLVALLPNIAKGIVKYVIKSTFNTSYFPQKVLSYYTEDELLDIFEQELLVGEIEGYALRLLKSISEIRS